MDLGLRYDLTVPLTRFYGHNHAKLPMPFRSLQVGPVWRAEKPQRGRYRQFYQCDIDMIGEPSVLAEAELIEATSLALAAIGLDGTTIRLSDRRFLAALAADSGVPEASRDAFFIVLDKLDRIGWEGVRSRARRAGAVRGRDLRGAGEDPSRWRGCRRPSWPTRSPRRCPGWPRR